jgi:hypothetical protein
MYELYGLPSGSIIPVDMLICELCCLGIQHGFGIFGGDLIRCPLEPAIKITKVARAA